jgi:acetyltransferase-like isoleucine patch superfamily enzyme
LTILTTVAPNAVILGKVKIGKCCYIGSNATILPNITISDNVVIGAGAVVTKNIIEIRNSLCWNTGKKN